MKMKSFVSFIIVAFVFMMGCATVPSPIQPQRTSAVINAPIDKVWSLLVDEVGSKYPIQTIEKEKGLITTQVVKMPVVSRSTSDYKKYVFIRYGGSSTGLYENLQMNMRITATESEPGKTMINIMAHYTALAVTYRSGARNLVRLNSNGSVENQILTNIEVKLE